MRRVTAIKLLKADDRPSDYQRKLRPITPQHIDGRTQAARRANKLAKAFEQQLGCREIDAALRVAIDRAAALNALAEDCRSRRLAGDLTITLNDLIRVDRTAALAVRRLGIGRVREREPDRAALSAYLTKVQA